MIVVIDNYDSFTYNLVHLVAQGNHEPVVFRNDEVTVEHVRSLQPAGILISPGPGRPDDAGISKQLIRDLGKDVPILGVCLGHQSIGEVFGGSVTYAPSLMHGKTSTIQHDGISIFQDVDQDFVATRYHSLVVNPVDFPKNDLEITAYADDVIMGLRHHSFPIEGIQFHPESILTIEGPKIINNWLKQVEAHKVGNVNA
jgi:anthranilate synthase component 2